MKTPSQTGLRSFSAVLPKTFVPLHDLQILSSAEALTAGGFNGAYCAMDDDELSLKAAQLALSRAAVDPLEIGSVLTVGALPHSHLRASLAVTPGVLENFCYGGSWLQDELGLTRATVCGIAQQGCVGMLTALRQARALLIAEPSLENVLVVGSDNFPRGECREILYNVISDAACAVIVSCTQPRFRWLGFHQISKGYYWDVAARQQEIIAAYFPTARAVVAGALSSASIPPGQIDLVIPTGVNATSWPILLRLCGIPEDRLFQPQERFGHTICADSFLMLDQALDSGALRPGMRILLFAFGFGSSWSALVLEVAEGGTIQ